MKQVSQTPGKSIVNQALLHDLFVVGTGVAAMFIKNPAHQEKAATLISILQGLVPHME